MKQIDQLKQEIAENEPSTPPSSDTWSESEESEEEHEEIKIEPTKNKRKRRKKSMVPKIKKPIVSRPVEDRRFQFRTVLYYSVYKSRTCDSFVSRMLCCRFKLPLSETIKKLS